MATQGNRKVIAIPYNINPNWMGGVIYVLNTIKILNWLEDSDKPIVRLFYRKELKRFVLELNYPYLEAEETEFPEIKKAYIQSWFSGENKFLEPILQKDTSAVFPLQDYPISYIKYPEVRLVSWYADLQHKYYPEFFTKRKLLEREARLKLMLKNTNHLVLSSEAVRADFEKFYDISQIRTHIYHFASVIDDFNFFGWDEVRKEKGLPEEYFMVSNQFHRHKNHKAVLEALGILKARGLKPVVAFTGRMPDLQQSDYIRNLHGLIAEHQLEKQVVFLGVLSRHEQLTLMRYAKAVIQPSLFEGWSTVIEDAISLQTPVIASNLKVNQEQLGHWAPYFDPHRPEDLTDLMEQQAERKDLDAQIYEPYDQRMKRAAESFMSIFSN